MTSRTLGRIGLSVVLVVILLMATGAFADAAAPKVEPPITSVVAAKVVPVKVIVEKVFEAKKADRQVVIITDLKGEFRASGFYTGKDTVVTAYHVTMNKAPRGPFGYSMGEDESIEHLLVKDKLGKVALGTVTYRDKKQDFAIIVLSKNKLSIKAVTLAVSPPNRGDELFVVGHPYRFRFSLSKGYLMHTTHTNKDGEIRGLASMAGTFGMSGSPVYNSAGEVVGITSAIFSVGDGMLFIPVSVWKDKLDAK